MTAASDYWLSVLTGIGVWLFALTWLYRRAKRMFDVEIHRKETERAELAKRFNLLFDKREADHDLLAEIQEILGNGGTMSRDGITSNIVLRTVTGLTYDVNFFEPSMKVRIT
jgi:hypothetical protein